MPELELAFSVEPVVGWRVWRLWREIDRRRPAHELAAELLAAEQRGECGAAARMLEPRLRSLTELGVWPPRARLDAVCGRGAGHGAPDAGCECGIWAFRTYRRAYDALRDYRYGRTPVVLGRVRLWGRIVEHEQGWRAQYAYPADLVVYGAQDPVPEALANAYGVEAVAARWPGERRAA